MSVLVGKNGLYHSREELENSFEVRGKFLYKEKHWDSHRRIVISVFTNGRTGQLSKLTNEELHSLLHDMHQQGWSLEWYVSK